MNNLESAEILGALAHPTRIGIFRQLLAVGDTGLPAGQLGQSVAISASTMSHHLSALESVGLISSRRQQRNIIYTIESDMVAAIISFLVHDCCDGRPELCNFASPPAAQTPCN